MSSYSFPRITKKYTVDYYWKGGAPPQCPQNTSQALAYYIQHKEWPFTLPNPEAPLVEQYYAAKISHQKRSGVWADQHFTSPINANFVFDQMFVPSVRGKRLLDACSGFGMLASGAVRHGHSVTLLERDYELFNDAMLIFADASNEAVHICEDFKNYWPSTPFDVVVSNPPFSSNSGVEFLEQLHHWLVPRGSAFLILPQGFIKKTRPARIPSALEKFAVLWTTDLPDEFAHTKVKCELVHLQYHP